MDEQRTIRVDQFLSHPPGRVWQALTDPVLLAKWLMPNDFQPVTGHRFTFLTEPRPDAAFDGVRPGPGHRAGTTAAHQLARRPARHNRDMDPGTGRPAHPAVS